MSNILRNVSAAYDVFYAIWLRAQIDLRKYSECPHFYWKIFYVWQFTSLHVYKILLRLVGVWRWYDKNASACFLEHGEFCYFSVIHVSQGSVATYVRCGKWPQCSIANFLLSMLVKEFLKSDKIWQSNCPKFGGFLFLGHSVLSQLVRKTD